MPHGGNVNIMTVMGDARMDGLSDAGSTRNEPKSVLARDLGDCRDNLRNSRSVFLIVRNYEKQGSNKIREETNRLTGGYYE